MASWQAKHRDPLFDQSTQAALERRGKEILGAALIAIGVLFFLMMSSYSPDDPSFQSATDEPAQNIFGQIGAYISSAIFMIAGYGAWVLSLGAVVWGLRLMLHRGEDRFMRALFLPFAMVAASIYATSMVPPEGWSESFGLGGHMGDMMMGGLLNMMPVKASIAIRPLALIAAVAAIGLTGFVLGVSRSEAMSLGRFLVTGLATAYDLAMTAAGRGATASVAGARSLRRKAEARRARISGQASPNLDDFGDGDDQPRARRMLSLPVRLRRQAPEMSDEPEDRPVESELVEPETHYDDDIPAPDQVALNARITDAVNSRSALSALTDRLSAARPDAPVTIAPPPADPALIVAPSRRPVAPSRQARAEAQPDLTFESRVSTYERPALSLLAPPSAVERHTPSQEALTENARMLEAVLDDYGVKGQITAVHPGPVVTLYELEPAPGLKASRVIGLADDIARSMSALAARVSTVPGRTVIGIELPNHRREKVVLREILSARAFGDSSMPLPLALGKDIGGEPIVANLAKMPHLLIAGTTGSGKSVAINTMILSLLYKLTPDECRLIMIDPKMLELSVYDGIPHLLSPVVTDPKKAVVALKWVVGEMEERYRRMSKMGVRNIEGYNGRVREALAKGETFKRTMQTGFDEDTGEPVFETEEFQPEAVPYIVVIVDEMADLMMVAGKEIEACIQRLAQMARASGIHIIMATQRPSVDVITGTIKANFPTRISFQVTSKIDSRTILGEMGAEQLLGMGDMLYMAGGSKITRVHGPFVSDEEVEEVVNHLKSFGPPSYKAGVVEGPEDDVASDIDAVLGLGSGEGGDAELYDLAVQIVAKDRKCSTSYIQRKLAIGYNKAARLVEQMEDQGIVSAANHVGKREVLVPEV
ncbi:MAG: cell division protein FtsK [Paracoccus denitrificans]|nr:MAG: cell division protein FtsK [Paracoccus denitrificans]PZO83874.1 MAG: cell division protein FtsK [Paracoccus denitrificans]